jgi:hypothetical protein
MSWLRIQASAIASSQRAAPRDDKCEHRAPRLSVVASRSDAITSSSTPGGRGTLGHRQLSPELIASAARSGHLAGFRTVSQFMTLSVTIVVDTA